MNLKSAKNGNGKKATMRSRRHAVRWVAAAVGCLVFALCIPAASMAEESNPNQYSCIGQIGAGQPEVGSEEQQVGYSFYCDGPITGYQLQSQIPVTGISSNPTITTLGPTVKDSLTAASPLSDTFSCSGEFPGYALNCVGLAKNGYELITGEFAIGTKICAEPRVDPLLTVTYAYLEKGVVTQAISGPIDLGRPRGCKPDKFSGSTRLAPRSPIIVKPKHHHKSKDKSKASHKTKA